ncbi:MAG: hypothetical protein ACJ0J2_03400 [Dehalococcoidia bacterium]
MNQNKIKALIRQIIKWGFVLFFTYLLFQLVRLLYILVFEGGKNPL